MNNFKHLYGMQHYIPAQNSSQGFHGVLFGYIEKYIKEGNSILLISEPEKVIPVFKERFPDAGYISNREHTGGAYTDLNIEKEYCADRADIILCQAVLEHICNPFGAIHNLRRMTNKNGYIFIHTHNIKMQYHAYPIDCLRYYKDFFVNITEYINLKLIEYDEWNEHIFIAYQKY